MKKIIMKEKPWGEDRTIDVEFSPVNSLVDYHNKDSIFVKIGGQSLFMDGESIHGDAIDKIFKNGGENRRYAGRREDVAYDCKRDDELFISGSVVGDGKHLIIHLEGSTVTDPDEVRFLLSEDKKYIEAQGITNILFIKEKCTYHTYRTNGIENKGNTRRYENKIKFEIAVEDLDKF